MVADASLLRVAILVLNDATSAADAIGHPGIRKRLGLVAAFAALDRVGPGLHCLFNVAASILVTILGQRLGISAGFRIRHAQNSGCTGAGSFDGVPGAGTSMSGAGGLNSGGGAVGSTGGVGVGNSAGGWVAMMSLLLGVQRL